MDEKIYYSAEDIAKMLGVSMGKSYKILREMNKDLASKGFLTIAGKIPVEYFKEKWYGGYSIAGQIGQEPKRNHRKGVLRQRKRQKNGMHISCCSNRRIRQ